MANPIIARLTGFDTCTALGITVTDTAPVLALCRALVEAGQDPSLRLEAYRGDMLALRVRSIGEGAGLTVEWCSDGRPRFRKYRPHPSAARPPMRFAGHPYVEVPQ